MPERQNPEESPPSPKRRSLIVRALWLGGILLVALVVSASLWALLATMGDTRAAQVAGGIVLGIAVCWGINFVGLVVMIAVEMVSGRGADAD